MQSTAAGERSAHVLRDGTPDSYDETCHVCRGPWRKGGASYQAWAGAALGIKRAIVEVCSAACAATVRT